ncbi:MAG: DUF1223 domain-containing protein [Hyphomicrobiales bacterium]|nr:DUF1223 domain-containing protein [Hyphomicrobiales bacterium]
MVEWRYRLAAGLTAAALIVAGVGPVGATGHASKSKPLIELFTSQGCSSCPPADALLQKFALRPDVVALTMPVDYWDYLGWKDTLAKPRNSARQRAYARARGDGQIYTPQVVVNGLKHVSGGDERAIEKTLRRTGETLKRRRVEISMQATDDTLTIEVGAAPAGLGKTSGTVWLALIKTVEKVHVLRGENRGRKLAYYNVVRELTPVGKWMGEAVTLKLPKHHLMQQGSDGSAVFLQQGRAGAILGAAELARW